MPYTLVYVDVKKEYVDDFKKITLYNCENSRLEEGNISFDCVQSKEDETKFVLLEHFRDSDAIEYHKTTEHYKKWAATVGDMMASPRTKTVCEMIK